METTCRVDEYDIGIVGFGTCQCIKRHRRRVGALLLLHHRHAHSLAPDTQLLHRRRAESIRRTEIDLLAGFLILIRQLADGGRLAHAIHAHHHNHIRLGRQRGIKVQNVCGVILRQQRGGFLHQNRVQLARAQVLIPLHTLLYPLDDTQRRLHTHIRGDKRFLKVVQHIIVHRTLACDSASYLAQHRLFALLESLVKALFLVLSE